MKIIVIFNPKSGPDTFNPDDFKEKVLSALKTEENKNIDIVFYDITKDKIDGDRIKSEAQKIKAIIISGGDGTISSNINLAVENDIPMGIIPNGTFNNFAGDNGIPEDTDEALKIIKEFNSTEIDIGTINGDYFINNSSIGLYTTSVKIRERTKKEYSLNKLTAMSLALIRTFYLFPMIYAEIKTKESVFKDKTPFVFIGNNKYYFNLLSLGMRDSLAAGKLYVYHTKCKYRLCLFRIAVKALFSFLQNEKDFDATSAEEITIHSKKKKITVAADGELYKMNTPLTYKILPRAVKLLVPNS
jgi:diacylglycerol kinase family enzyme